MANNSVKKLNKPNNWFLSYKIENIQRIKQKGLSLSKKNPSATVEVDNDSANSNSQNKLKDKEHSNINNIVEKSNIINSSKTNNNTYNNLNLKEESEEIYD